MHATNVLCFGVFQMEAALPPEDTLYAYVHFNLVYPWEDCEVVRQATLHAMEDKLIPVPLV